MSARVEAICGYPPPEYRIVEIPTPDVEEGSGVEGGFARSYTWDNYDVWIFTCDGQKAPAKPFAVIPQWCVPGPGLR